MLLLLLNQLLRMREVEIKSWVLLHLLGIKGLLRNELWKVALILLLKVVLLILLVMGLVVLEIVVRDCEGFRLL